jgi:hypothetical protein
MCHGLMAYTYYTGLGTPTLHALYAEGVFIESKGLISSTVETPKSQHEFRVFNIIDTSKYCACLYKNHVVLQYN